MSRRNTGFTMVEMLVAVGILGVVVAGVMETFVVQNRAYSVVDETTEAQQNLRAISYLIERDLRSTGFMVDEAAAACGVDNTNAPDTLYVTDNEPIDPEDADSATLGSTVGGYTSTVSEQWLTLGNLAVDPDAPNPEFFDTNGDGTNDSDFQEGRAAILADPASPGHGTACGMITGIRIGTREVRVAFENRILNSGSLVLVPATAYTVDTVTDTNGDGVSELRLLRNGLALASDVEDFQVAYFIDSDGNGVVTNDDEYPGSAAATQDYQSLDTDHSDLREIRFSIVVRSRNADTRYTEGFVQARENRAAVGASDGFRRRVFDSTVRQRNIGYRGVQPAG
jgi:prepilin-type N-terminal cleavage/methylation domain-containing protein